MCAVTYRKEHYLHRNWNNVQKKRIPKHIALKYSLNNDIQKLLRSNKFPTK